VWLELKLKLQSQWVAARSLGRVCGLIIAVAAAAVVLTARRSATGRTSCNSICLALELDAPAVTSLAHTS
jgi:hypothetical protein